MTDETTDDFDWGQLGAAWWTEVGKQLGAKPRQLKFAAAKHRGCSNTQAAREAGYKADGDGMRATGYRLARSNITERLLSFAAAEASGEGYDGSVDRAEGRRILSSLARGSDPSIRIRAIEQLSKFDEADRAARTKEELSAKDAAAELLLGVPNYGPVIVAEAIFSEGGTLWGCPYLNELAPILASKFPGAWQRYRSAIKEPEHLKEFDALANGPIRPVESFVDDEIQKKPGSNEETGELKS